MADCTLYDPMLIFLQGLDLSDIELIVQWKVPTSMNTLWQRFGRAARGYGRFAFAILIAEKEHFDEERERKALLAEKRKQQPSRKRKRAHGKSTPSKRARPVRHSVSPSRLQDRTHSPISTSRFPQVHLGAYSTNPSAPTGIACDEVEAGEVSREVIDLEDLGGDTLGLEMEDADNDVAGEDDRMEVDQAAPEAEEETEEDGEVQPQSAEILRMSDEERRRLYDESAHTPARSARAARKEVKVLEPAMDDLINAKRRGFACRRIPITLYYSNDKRGK